MVRIYEQVDVAAIDGSIEACSGLTTLAKTSYNREVQVSGTLGSGSHEVEVDTSTIERGIHFESEANEPTSTSWPAGTWDVFIGVLIGNANVRWREVHICRINSSGVNQATIGSDTFDSGLIAGTQGAFITGSADTGASASDRFYYVLGMSRDVDAHGNQSVTILNSQKMTTPFHSRAERGILRGYMRGVGRGV